MAMDSAAPKDRYERELVLTRSSVRCQEDRGLAAAGNQGNWRLGGAGFVRRTATPVTCAFSSWPGAGCLPAGPGSAGRQGRAHCAAAARALAWSKKRPAGGSLFADGVKIRSWVAIIQCLGCLASQPFRRDSRVLARQCARSSFLFRLAAISMSARRPGGCPGPEVPGARVEGRLSSTAVCCHTPMPRPRRYCCRGPRSRGWPGRCAMVRRRTWSPGRSWVGTEVSCAGDRRPYWTRRGTGKLTFRKGMQCPR
jgi:hypothetical protein